MIKEWKYILRRIIIAVGIVLCLEFLNGCEVHAETYNLDSSQVTSYYRVNNATLINLNYNTWYSIGSDILSNLRLGFTPLNPKTCTDYGCSEGLQPGQYLFDFYLLTDGAVNITNCNQLSSDFQNVNITTGNWVSNQITSSCVDVSTYVESGYATYLHILYSFTADAFATEYRFYFNYGIGWLNGSSKFKVLLGNVHDFDQTIINNFKQQKLNEQQINQNNTMINQNNTIINQNNQIKDSLTNSTVDDPSGTFNQFESYLPENGVITQLITLPISLFQRVLSSINGTCTQYNLGNLLGTDLILPCINISNYIGTTLWNVIDVLFSGFFVLVIGKKMIKAFNNFSSMEEGDVLD